MGIYQTLQVKKYTSTDGTVRYGKEEYFINGFEHTKDEWKKARKSGDGLPWYKLSVAKARF